jgi:uncharacterized membrane protein
MKSRKSKVASQKSKIGEAEFCLRFVVICFFSVLLFAFSTDLGWTQDNVSVLEDGALLVFHPIIVHFAIALVLFGFATDFLANVRSQTKWQEIGHVCFFSGVIALGLAVVSGWIEQELPRPATVFDEHMRLVLFRHEYLGYGLFAFFLVLAIVRSRIHGRLPVIFILLSMLGSIGIFVQGYWGGELVYRYGVGVRAVQVLSAPLLDSAQKKP